MIRRSARAPMPGTARRVQPVGGEIQSYTNRSYNKVITGISVRASCFLSRHLD